MESSPNIFKMFASNAINSEAFPPPIPLWIILSPVPPNPGDVAYNLVTAAADGSPICELNVRMSSILTRFVCAVKVKFSPDPDVILLISVIAASTAISTAFPSAVVSVVILRPPLNTNSVSPERSISIVDESSDDTLITLLSI